jgi:hypothetical protein
MLKISNHKCLNAGTFGALKIAVGISLPLYLLTLQFSSKWVELDCELLVLAWKCIALKVNGKQ